MGRYIFRDFDQFAECLPGIEGGFIPTARQTAEWWIEGVVISRNPVHSSQVGGPMTFAGGGMPDVFTIVLPLTDPRKVRVDGEFLEADSFIMMRDDHYFTLTSRDVVRWTGVCMSIGTPLIESELLSRASSDGPCLRSGLPYLDRLRWVMSRIVTGNDVDFNDSVVTAAAEQELAICLAHVLERSWKKLDRHEGRPQLSRGRVIARTLSLIEANEGQPMFIDDLCRATGVSERSLRNIFYEFFGVGPMRLLKLRQLREIRAALLRADPQRDTVARIAARFGIWDFSLFARNYKALFGESPSRTLRTPLTDVRTHPNLSWLRYASRIFLDDTAPAPRPFASTSEDPIAPASSSNVFRIVN